MIKRIAHVAVATDSIAETSKFYRRLGLRVDHQEVVSDQNVKVAVMRIGDSALEFIEPVEADSPISRFLARRGRGIHHVSLEVEDLAARLEELKTAGVCLIDEKPRVGAEGRLIAFVHPSSTGGVLIELTESGEGASGSQGARGSSGAP